MSGGGTKYPRRERNQHRRTHDLHAANRARIEAERADMEKRWREAGKLWDCFGPRGGHPRAKARPYFGTSLGSAMTRHPSVDRTFCALLAREARA